VHRTGGTAATASSSRRVLSATPRRAIVRLVARYDGPRALELAAVHVDDDDALVAVAVGDVGLVVLVVERDLRPR